MANYVFVDPALGVPAPASGTYTFATSISSNPLWPLGYEVRAVDSMTGTVPSLGAGVFVHCVGGASAPQSAGQLVMIMGNTVNLAGTALKASNFPLGIAAGAISATNVAGWVQVQGMVDNARISNHAVAVGASCFLASTTGLLATTQTATNDARYVVGINFPVSVTSSQSISVTAHLNRPMMIGSAGFA